MCCHICAIGMSTFNMKNHYIFNVNLILSQNQSVALEKLTAVTFIAFQLDYYWNYINTMRYENLMQVYICFERF